MLYRAVFLLSVLTGMLAAQYGTSPKPSEQDYPVHAKMEKLSIGAEYLVHSFSGGPPNNTQTFIANDYLVVEVALYPAKGEIDTLNDAQFSLRLNGKQVLDAQPPGFVAGSLKYPEWGTHPRTMASVGPVIFGAPQPTERFPGDPQGLPAPPAPRAPTDNPSGMDKQEPLKADELVIQTALPEGEHHGPVSGYLYFAYRGKIKRIHTLELDYNSPTSSATLSLQQAGQ
jgi:hypothetical protein